MVNENGYLKLINFSTSKVSKSENNQSIKTYTIIGTPHYMAPDIILGKGYTNLVDLWSLGVCLYEFICGVLPFGDSADGAYEIYEEIMQADIRFPEFVTDKKAKKLVDQLLSHNPEHRHQGSFLNLKSNPFFEDIDWNAFLNQSHTKNKVPYIPKSVKDRIDQDGYRANHKLFDKLAEIDRRVAPLPVYLDKWDSFGPKLKF